MENTKKNECMKYGYKALNIISNIIIIIKLDICELWDIGLICGCDFSDFLVSFLCQVLTNLSSFHGGPGRPARMLR